MKEFEIIIGFSTHKDPNIISDLIRATEGTEYSHVYVRIYSKSLDRWLCYHASQSNLHFTSMCLFIQQNRVVEEYAIAISKEEKIKVLQLCVDRAGVPYGRLQIIGMAFVRYMKLWFGKKVSNPFHDGEKTQVCSELAARVLKVLDAPLDLKDAETEGPKWINGVMKEMVKQGRAKQVHFL